MNCESVIIAHLINVKTAPTNIEKITIILIHFVVWNVLGAVKIRHELIIYSGMFMDMRYVSIL